MDEQEFERDEQLLEARRLKRLEQRRRRKVQQRIVLGLLLVILILSLVLIVRGCKSRSAAGAARRETADRAAECAGIGRADRAGHHRHDCGRGRYHDVRRAARRGAARTTGPMISPRAFAAVSGSTVSADLTVGQSGAQLLRPSVLPGSPISARRRRWQRRSARLASMFCRRQTRTRFRTVFPGFRVPSGIWTRQGFRMWERMRRRTIRRASGACCSRTSTA